LNTQGNLRRILTKENVLRLFAGQKGEKEEEGMWSKQLQEDMEAGLTGSGVGDVQYCRNFRGT
jgi:hypothetical protein